MSDEWSLLSKIPAILEEQHFVRVPDHEPVVRFEFPEDLKKLVDFTLDSDEPRDQAGVEQIIKQVLQYSVRTGHANFHNQLFAGVDPYGLAGSWITDALNTSQYTFEVGPAFTLIEDALIAKCLRLFGFVEGDGILSPGGSISNMYAMVAARYRALPGVKRTGLANQPTLVAFTSEDAHYSIKKAVHWLGIGIDNLVLVRTDPGGCMIPEELEKAICTVLASGRKPFFVNSTAGTTVLGAFDPFERIAAICERHNLWLHVDSCLGGSAILSRKHSHLLAGVERADSLAWNPHKTLGAPLQCSIFLLKHKGLLHECNSANADYLFQQDKFYDVSYDTGDKSVQCGRKVDAFKIWLMFKARGDRGLAELVENAFDCAEFFTREVRKRDGFRLVLEQIQYTNVGFWYVPKKLRVPEEQQDDAWWAKIYEVTAIIKERLVKQGSVLIGYVPRPHKKIGNFFRMVVTCHPRPTHSSMKFVIDEIERVGEML
ncbi:acidic amino acid decarboxylase GADL1 isoform X1 [Culex quinquefasciatus]|uniref:acidic amino acid decarboxylase GADL1 isoform X1 n=2 Tax=Culex quinquefasciatus TaxID=7176 RepID=UPI0018E3F399|nr:acidic amino acid decarboxylase GADL1 isoform X1 [Culex quinquefasciatus]XP_038118551.1 acidic amino acid decarboxylase GADL1 isoform X1 [Culex quinquefasciatus]